MDFTGNDGILFIDDTPVLLELVSRYAAKWGLKPYTAETPEQAMNIFKEHADIRIVVIDLHLGKGQINGLELMNHFAGFRNSRKVKLCLLTGDKDSRLEELAPKFGADAYLTKPVEPRKLKSTIMNLLDVESEEELISSQYRIKVDNALAALQDSTIIPNFYVKEITVNSLVLESSAAIEEGTLLKLHIPKLARMLGCSPFFTIKCQRCRSYSKIRKKHGDLWCANEKAHLKGHHDDNSLIRALIVDISKETQAAIELFQKAHTEKQRQASSI